MGQRENDIISEVRITLNDTDSNNPRWSTERLMKLLSNGQDDMCRNIPMIVNKAKIIMIAGVEEYKMPNDSLKLLYASTLNSNTSSVAESNIYSLNIVSYDELERDNPAWEGDYSSELSAVVVNALSQQTIRPYPKVSSAVAIPPVLRIRYQAMPTKLGWDEILSGSVEELSLNEMWDYALTQYVIGMAFLDYGDSASISRSQVALGLYGNEASRAGKLAKKSFAKRAVTTNYRAKIGRSYNDTRRGYGFGSSRFNY